jgi:hypothetical protein
MVLPSLSLTIHRQVVLPEEPGKKITETSISDEVFHADYWQNDFIEVSQSFP